MIGLGNIIRQHRPTIVTEVNPTFLAACGSSFGELVTLMSSLDYRGYKLGLKKRNGQYDFLLTNLKDENCDAVWLHVTAHKIHAERLGDRIAVFTPS